MNDINRHTANRQLELGWPLAECCLTSLRLRVPHRTRSDGQLGFLRGEGGKCVKGAAACNCNFRLRLPRVESFRPILAQMERSIRTSDIDGLRKYGLTDEEIKVVEGSRDK